MSNFIDEMVDKDMGEITSPIPNIIDEIMALADCEEEEEEDNEQKQNESLDGVRQIIVYYQTNKRQPHQ